MGPLGQRPVVAVMGSDRLPRRGSRIATLRETAREDAVLVAQPLEGESDFEPQFGQIVAADVAEFVMLEIAPEALDGIEVGRIAGQPFQLQPRSRSGRQEVLNGLPPMDRRAIPDHQQFAGELAEQVLQEAHDRRPAERLALHLVEHAPIGREGPDHGPVIARERGAEDRRLAAGSIGAHDRRDHIEAGLIDPNDRTPLALGFT